MSSELARVRTEDLVTAARNAGLTRTSTQRFRSHDEQHRPTTLTPQGAAIKRAAIAVLTTCAALLIVAGTPAVA